MNPISFGAGVAAAFAALVPAGVLAAGITATATIAGGKLVVMGTSPLAGQAIRLDGRFNATSNASKAFAFRLASYFPFDCIVDLRAGANTVSVPVTH